MATNVRAKFTCQSEAKFWPGTQKTYEFYAAHGDENKTWAKATPSGNLKITIDNPDAQIFEVGKSYYLDFSEAPAKE